MESAVNLLTMYRYQQVIDDICNLNWSGLSREDLVAVAWAYYYFSVQFRENLELACDLNPSDKKLAQLFEGECSTDNLSPFEGIADDGEKMNHDEFMRRVLEISSADLDVRMRIERLGASYLAAVRQEDDESRAISIASYEDGGLERVFEAMLRAPDWTHPALQAFRHFLVEHIKFDSDCENGHGALSRHMAPDDRINPLWQAFYTILVGAAPALLN
jgi:hypothetical protein